MSLREQLIGIYTLTTEDQTANSNEVDSTLDYRLTVEVVFSLQSRITVSNHQFQRTDKIFRLIWSVSLVQAYDFKRETEIMPDTFPLIARPILIIDIFLDRYLYAKYVMSSLTSTKGPNHAGAAARSSHRKRRADNWSRQQYHESIGF